MIKEASFYHSLSDSRVQCDLCPVGCKLDNGMVGVCGCRFNKQGKLFTDNYGEVVTLEVDPIEKKPLYHFYPGTMILSTGANGCNLGCLHCQNWTISQTKIGTRYVSPDALVEEALRHDSIGVAFTYTEPMIWYEYIMDAAPLLHRANLKVVLVTNGYIMPEPLAELIEHIDAANVDLKGIQPEFYTKVCKGKVEPVLKTIETLAASDVHLEVTNLLIPGMNDSNDDISELVDFIATLSDSIPLHLSAYHPMYKMNVNATTADTMLRGLELARKKLKHLFAGNIALNDGSNSVCPECGTVLIERNGYRTRIVGLDGTRCSGCNVETGIVR